MNETVEISVKELRRLQREEELRTEDANEMINLRRRLVRAENCIHEIMSVLDDSNRLTMKPLSPAHSTPEIEFVYDEKGEFLSFCETSSHVKSAFNHYYRSNKPYAS